MWGKNAHHDQFFTFLTADLDPFKPGHPCGVLWIVVCRMGCVTRCLASCFSMPSGLHCSRFCLPHKKDNILEDCDPGDSAAAPSRVTETDCALII